MEPNRRGLLMGALATAAMLFAAAPGLAATGQTAEALFDQGLREYLAEDYKKASKTIVEALDKDPGNSRYQVWAGRAKGRWAESVPKFFFWRALDLAKETRGHFEKAVELDDTSELALTDMLEFYVEAPGIVGGGLDKARRIAERLAKVNPAAGEYAAARIAEKDGDAEKAGQHLRKALQLEPEKLRHKLNLASFLARRGEHQESDRLFAEAFEKAPEAPGVWFSRAKALVRSDRNPEEARRLLNRYLKAELQPDDDPPSYARDLLKEI